MFTGMLRPCPVAPTAASAMSGLRLRSPPVTRPPFRTLKMQAAGTCRRRHVCLSRKGAADSPGDDVPPESESLRFYRESVEKFEREYSAALRALHGHQHKDKDLLTISEDKLFRNETNTIDEYIMEIELDRSFLYGEGRRLARILCLRAGQATDLASKIMAYAGLRSHQPSEISLETIEQTIRAYVSTFVKIADDTCHRKADQETIISFLRALGGLGAISHILFEDALFAANNIEGSSSEYIPNPDVGAYNRIFQRKITQLEGGIRSSSPVRAREILVPTLHEAMMHADLFVFAQTIGRKKALAHVLENNNKFLNVGPDNKEHDAFGGDRPLI